MRRGVRLAFDVGKARVGVARCDSDAIMALPVQTLVRDRYGADIEEAADLVAFHEAIEVVVGLPRPLKGGSSASTKDARHWAGELYAIASVPVRLVDERLTTVTAHRVLHEAGLEAKAFRPVVDQAAAVVILEHALATERQTGRPAGDLVAQTQRGRRRQ